MDSGTLVVIHNADAGFFSCYTIRLLNILLYFNHTKTCPPKIDSSNLFSQYKYNKYHDYTYEYIKHNESQQIEYTSVVKITDEDREDQFSNYKNINFETIKPFIDKYFSPSDNMLKKVGELETKYKFDYDNLAVFYYRGTDKCIETNLCEYGAYIERAEQLKRDNPNIQFLIVSDELELIQMFATRFPKTILFEELIHNMGRSFIHSVWMLSSVLIMSKAKHIVCSSGNVSLWIILFRGHNNNIQQYLSPKEYIYGVKNKNYNNNEQSFWL
jgi:hypothetical protein